MIEITQDDIESARKEAMQISGEIYLSKLYMEEARTFISGFSQNIARIAVNRYRESQWSPMDKDRRGGDYLVAFAFADCPVMIIPCRYIDGDSDDEMGGWYCSLYPGQELEHGSKLDEAFAMAWMEIPKLNVSGDAS